MSQLAEIVTRFAAGQIPTEIPVDCDCRDELQRLTGYLSELSRFTQSLAAGDLDATLRLPGSLAGSLKGLHANSWQDGSSVFVAISDDGCGIPDDIKHRMGRSPLRARQAKGPPLR